MNVKKLLVAMILVGTTVLHLVAHPGPEPHPTVKDLEEAVSKLDRTIDDMEHRLLKQIAAIEVPVAEDSESVTGAFESATNESIGELTASIDDLKELVNTIVAVGAAALAVLTGISTILGFRLRALRKRFGNGLEDVGMTEENGQDKSETKPTQEEENQVSETRVVTHTLKERIGSGTQSTVKELHNPDAAWSPRTRDEAIDDILNRGIQYRTRGPRGNEAEVRVRFRRNNPHLRTESDEHDGNNLSELPDPP